MINTFHVSGHLGAAPVFQTFEKSDAKLARFSIAVNQPKKNGQSVEPMWVECEAWGSLFDRVRACGLDKGKLINVEGSMAPSSYERNVNGVKTIYKTMKLKVNKFVVFTPREKDDNTDSNAETDQPRMHLVNEPPPQTQAKRQYNRKSAT